MDISALTNVSADDIKTAAEKTKTSTGADTFANALDSAMGMVNETNSYINNAESEEIRFALGQSENTHDLQVAQYKANSALQFTVSVRDKLVEAYKEIMNMQI